MSSVSIWKTLGFDGPTSDDKAIRRAYAKALRNTRPDEDPEGFMALRDAFERAKTYASFHPSEEEEEDTPSLILNDEKLALSTKLAPSPPQDDDGEPISTADYLSDELEPAIPILPSIESTDISEPKQRQAVAPEPEKFSAHFIIDDAAALLKSHRRNSEPAWKDLLSRGHDLPLDDYNVFERQLLALLLDYFGYFETPPAPPTGLLRFVPRPKPKPKAKLDKDTGTFIFTSMGWNRWKSYPDYVQEELLYILYELGIKDRPKAEETTKHIIFSELRYVLKGFGITVVFALLGVYFEPPEDMTPPPPALANAGSATYGDYSYSAATGEWGYDLSGQHEALKTLKPGDILTDKFELQMSDKDITTFYITIKGTEGKPEIKNNQTTRPIKGEPPAGIHTIFFLIAGIAGLFAIIRLIGFTIGLIFGLIGLAFSLMVEALRRVFRR